MPFAIHVLTIRPGRNNDNGSHSIKGPDLLNVHLSHIIVLAETVKHGEMGTFLLKTKLTIPKSGETYLSSFTHHLEG